MGQNFKKSSGEKFSGYSSGPPWFFRGSALYQLHLVKAEIARTFIPKELKLVEAFGYTLGGFFLAHYDDSPASEFDELVVIAGIVWNPPTSCAWAGRVLVNSQEACQHGRKEVGLPSNVGIFSKRSVETKERPSSNFTRFLNMIGINSNFRGAKECTELQVSEIKDSTVMSLCDISLPYSVPKSDINKEWMGPKIRMALPSFSGRTTHNPQLLRYSCQIECRVRPVKPAKLLGNCDDGTESRDIKSKTEEDDSWNHSISVLLSKPILALKFSQLEMQVEGPAILMKK